MTDYTALIERLGKEGGSRELDAAIWYAVVEKPQHGDKIDKDMARNRWPHYTTSLDAAIALCERVLLGWEWSCGHEVHFLPDDTPIRKGVARVFKRNESSRITPDMVFDAEGESPYTAFVGAILKALRALSTEDGK